MRKHAAPHNRAENPQLRVNLLWTADGEIGRDLIAAPSAAVAALAGGPEVEVAGRLLESPLRTSDSIGSVRRGPSDALALLTTATMVVHHRCITATAFGGIWRDRRSTRNSMVQPNLAKNEPLGRRIRLTGLLRKKPW